jgi:hypothetical protein
MKEIESIIMNGHKRPVVWRVRPTNLKPSVGQLSRENVGASTSQNPMGLHGLYRDSFTFFYLHN